MRNVKKFLYSTLLVLVLISAFLAFLINTTPGFYLILQLADLKLPGRFEINKLEGSFLDQGFFKEFSYIDKDFSIRLKNAKITWELSDLFHKKITIKNLTADHITLTRKTVKEDTPINLKLPFAIQMYDAKVQEFELINGQQKMTFHEVNLSALLKKREWSIHYLRLNYFNVDLVLKGKMKTKAPFTTSGEVQFSTQDHLPITGTVSFFGDTQAMYWQGKLKGSIDGQIKGHIREQQEFASEIIWSQLAIATDHDKSFIAPIKTDKNSPPRIHTNRENFPHLIKGKGQLLVQGKLNDFTITGKGEAFLPVKTNWTVGGSFLNQKATLNTTVQLANRQYPFNGTITIDPFQINAQILLGLNQLTLHKEFKLQQWEMKFNLPKPAQLSPYFTGLNSTIFGKATFYNAQKGNMTIHISPGTFQTEKEKPQLIHFQGGKITSRLDAKALVAEGVIKLDKQKLVNLVLKLPLFRLDKPNMNHQKIEGKLNVNIDSLAFIPEKNQIIENPNANIAVNLTAKGTLQKPVIEGIASLTHGTVTLPHLNVTIRPIELKLMSNNKSWKLTGFGISEGKTIHLTGEGTLIPELSGQVKFQGDNFPAMRTAEYTFNVSPNLVLDIKPNHTELRGEILIPTARLKPITFSNTVNLSDDVVIVSNQKAALPINLTTNINLVMGDDVALNVKGMQGALEGSIRIQQAPYSDPHAVGELFIRNGKYKAFGQDLTIEQGQLFFSGGTIGNPGIRLRAVRTIDTTSSDFNGSNKLFDFNVQNLQNLDYGAFMKVGIEISGRINSPKVKLFSIPTTLSQADILSLLLLGVPASQASKSGGQLLLTAISAMNLDSGSKGLQLIEQLKQSLGFDFNLQSTTEINQKTKQMQEGTAFVVGKSLSKRLYLSYNIGLYQADSNLLVLKYLLNRFFSVQVSTSDSGSGIDLLYTHHKE